jgi:hypothetical protein
MVEIDRDLDGRPRGGGDLGGNITGQHMQILADGPPIGPADVFLGFARIAVPVSFNSPTDPP